MLGLFELTIGFSGVNNGVANFAHLGGMLFGYLLIRYWGQKRRY
jgi:membrane associated rhomboid family serine protease